MSSRVRVSALAKSLRLQLLGFIFLFLALFAFKFHIIFGIPFVFLGSLFIVSSFFAWRFSHLRDGLADFVAVKVSSLPHGYFLDLGTGSGFLALRLAERSPRCHIVGIDGSARRLDRGREDAELEGIENVEFRKGDVLNLPFTDSSFDVVVSGFFVHGVKDGERMISEACRVLRKDGFLIIVDYKHGFKSFLVDWFGAFRALRRYQWLEYLSQNNMNKVSIVDFDFALVVSAVKT